MSGHQITLQEMIEDVEEDSEVIVINIKDKQDE